MFKKSKKNQAVEVVTVSDENQATAGGLRKSKKPARKKVPKRMRHTNADSIRKNLDAEMFSEKRKIVKIKTKRSLLMKTYTKQQIKYLDLMRISPSQRIKYARSRLLTSLGFAVFGLIFGLLFHNKYIIFGVLGFAVVLYWQRGSSLKKQYASFMFKQELAFAKFFSNLAPVLTKVVNGKPMYQVLKDLENRTEDPQSKKTIQLFMLELNENPGSDEPYIHVAQNFSNSPESVTRMLSVAQIVKSNAGIPVVRRLARSSADELMAKVEQIIDAKKRKFASITTQVTMAAMPMIFGIVIGMIIAQMTSMFSTLHLG